MKKNMNSSYLLLSNALALLFFALVCCCNSMPSNETDRLALMAFKAQIREDPNQVVMSSWNDSTHFCMWHGVTCSRRHFQRVTKLSLSSLNLSGSISPHIGNLSFLGELSLSNNSLTNIIPSEIGHLRRLQRLHLGNNSLTGRVPASLSNCFNLTFLAVYNNKLTGNIPPELGSLSKLEILALQLNRLTGKIPPSLGNLSRLAQFDVGDNNLEGSIPSSLGKLKMLTNFDAQFNMLSGTIPPSIYNISTLITFTISNNQIKGTMPPSLFTTLPNLQILSIFANQFTGSLPLSLSNATNLVAIQANDNSLTGKVPNLQKLQNLVTINIAANHFGSGSEGDLSFVSTLNNATMLEWLIIGSNNFGGMLPASVANLSSLSILHVYENLIQGSIPVGIGNLVNMKYLDFSINMFTGNIPTDIGKLSSIGSLIFYNNSLSGSLPPSLGNLTSLVMLNLFGNAFNGSIPSSLGKCRSLLLLDLADNNLSGYIPPQVMSIPSLSIYLNLSQNHLSGSIPSEVGMLTNIGVLDFSDNMLSGKLPISLDKCESLEALFLQGNHFEGTIPSSLGSLKGIQVLDFSRNNLSGEIPDFFTELGGLKKVNLSFNDFWGEVPVRGVFNNASDISVIGNSKLCGGVSDLHLSKCESKRLRSHSKKLTVLLVCLFTIVGVAMLLTFLVLCINKKRSKGTPSSSSKTLIAQVSYHALLKATNGFSTTNLIGAGSFGSVYKGVLEEDGAMVVAVKVFHMLRRGASKSFLAECDALRNIRHRNLVPVITACSSVDSHGNDFKALVYKFMENGSLEEWLHHPTTDIENVPKSLSLVQRIDIAIDVACAIDYLHNQCETPIIHCDIKPSNVLLDNELTGHLGDFGLARILSNLADKVSTNQSSSIGIRGTVGYAATEYGMGSEVSKYGDVYSFGILLLEMFTGKRPTDHMFMDGLNLHKYVKMAIGERVSEISDSSLFHDYIPRQRSKVDLEECLSSILGIGVACSVESPTDRKNINEVVSELKKIRATLGR